MVRQEVIEMIYNYLEAACGMHGEEHHEHHWDAESLYENLERLREFPEEAFNSAMSSRLFVSKTDCGHEVKGLKKLREDAKRLWEGGPAVNPAIKQEVKSKTPLKTRDGGPGCPTCGGSRKILHAINVPGRAGPLIQYKPCPDCAQRKGERRGFTSKREVPPESVGRRKKKRRQ